MYGFIAHFTCSQGRHFLLFCWLPAALILDQGEGTLKALCRRLPPRIRYWAVLRLVRCGQWDGQELLADMVAQVLPWLPPPSDGVLHVLVDSTLKEKCGQQHPLSRKARTSEYAAYTFGFEMVLLVASWGHYRIPLALRVVDSKIKGHQNRLCRQMLQEFVPPRWARPVIVVADAGFAANQTFETIQVKGYAYVFALARTRKSGRGST